MLQPAEFAVGVARALGELGRNQAEAGGHAEQRDVAQVPVSSAYRWEKARTRSCTANSTSIIPPRVVLEVEQPGAVGMRGVHLVAHVGDLGRELDRVAAAPQDSFPD